MLHHFVQKTLIPRRRILCLMRQVLLKGKGIYLKKLSVADATPEYVAWLNDPEVNQYLETRFATHTLESVRDFVKKNASDPDTLFLGIFLDSGKHIGNVKLGPINRQHRFADLGIMIGDRQSWGKGYATQAIRLVCEYAFAKLGLNKVTAGAYAENASSIKAFLNAGFTEEGLRRKMYSSGGKRVDAVLLGLNAPTPKPS